LLEEKSRNNAMNTDRHLRLDNLASLVKSM